MNFLLNNSDYDVIFDIFEDNENKSNIDDIIYSFETSSGFDCLKTNVLRNVAFKVDGVDNITPNTSDRYLCNAIIEIQHVQHEKKDEDEDEDVKYYAQICLTDCSCDIVKSDRKINSILEPKKVNPILESKSKSKPKSKPKSKAESKD